MAPSRLLASTTSHKGEALLPSLQVFAKLGLCDVDVNLHHIIERGTSVESVVATAAESGLRLQAASGGWCDFFQPPPQIDETFQSIDRQVAIARGLGVTLLRIFFGRLAYADYSVERRDVCCRNLQALAARHPAIQFVVENHDGASLHPEVCGDILACVDRPNIRMNFDPINFERVGVNHVHAFDILQPLIGHAHLKGLDKGEFCEFGAGDIDLTPMLRRLIDGGYQGRFSVEYEGDGDKTLRLLQSVEHARTVLAALGV